MRRESREEEEEEEEEERMNYQKSSTGDAVGGVKYRSSPRLKWYNHRAKRLNW